MDQEKYREDLKEIKDIMNRSSRFISLSGLSGVSAGLIALAGAFMAFRVVYSSQGTIGFDSIDIGNQRQVDLLIIAFGTLILGIGSVVFFTTRRARKMGEEIWDFRTKRVLVNLAIPLAVGGVLCIMFLSRGYIGLLAPFTLIFYGLALINAGNYTLPEIRTLGMLEVALGLISMVFIGYGLFFWAVGFGILHIVFGLMMQSKYK